MASHTDSIIQLHVQVLQRSKLGSGVGRLAPAEALLAAVATDLLLGTLLPT